MRRSLRVSTAESDLGGRIGRCSGRVDSPSMTMTFAKRDRSVMAVENERSGTHKKHPIADGAARLPNTVLWCCNCFIPDEHHHKKSALPALARVPDLGYLEEGGPKTGRAVFVGETVHTRAV